MILSKEYVKRAKVESKMQDNDWRRYLTRMAIDYYNYNQHDYMLDVIAARYPSTWTDLHNYIVTIDLSRALTNQLAKLFVSDPAIVLNTAAQGVQDAFNDVLDSVNLYAMLPIIDRYTETCNKVGVAPLYNPRTGKIRMDFITPDRCIVWQDENDPTTATQVAYNIRYLTDTPIAEKTNIYAVWTDDLYRVATLRTDGTIDRLLEPAIPNPYKRIPIAWFANEPQIDTFWSDRLFPMVNANERANIQLTNLDVALDFQSFSLLYTIGMPDSAKLLTGVQRYVNIPINLETGKAEGSIGYATPSPQLDTVHKIINENIGLSASMMGISTDAIKQGSSYNSGYQLRLSKSDVIDRNMSKRAMFREPLRELIQLIMDCKTLNSNIKLPDNADIGIDFADIKIENDPLQEEQLRTMKIANGTMSRVDAIMQDNPDLSREDAIKRIEQIDADNNRFSIPNDQFEDGAFTQ